LHDKEAEFWAQLFPWQSTITRGLTLALCF